MRYKNTGYTIVYLILKSSNFEAFPNLDFHSVAPARLAGTEQYRAEVAPAEEVTLAVPNHLALMSVGPWMLVSPLTSGSPSAALHSTWGRLLSKNCRGYYAFPSNLKVVTYEGLNHITIAHSISPFQYFFIPSYHSLTCYSPEIC